MYLNVDYQSNNITRSIQKKHTLSLLEILLIPIDSFPEIELDCGNIVVGERSELVFFFDLGELLDFLMWFLLFTLSLSLLFAECDVISVNILLYSRFHNNFKQYNFLKQPSGFQSEKGEKKLHRKKWSELKTSVQKKEKL